MQYINICLTDLAFLSSLYLCMVYKSMFCLCNQLIIADSRILYLVELDGSPLNQSPQFCWRFNDNEYWREIKIVYKYVQIYQFTFILFCFVRPKLRRRLEATKFVNTSKYVNDLWE